VTHEELHWTERIVVRGREARGVAREDAATQTDARRRLDEYFGVRAKEASE
jgi:hypothetical protein